MSGFQSQTIAHPNDSVVCEQVHKKTMEACVLYQSTHESPLFLLGMLIFGAKELSLRQTARKEKSMDSKKPGFNSIDEYIQTFPQDIQKILQEVRATIKAAAPEAEEKISYQMPTFFLKGNLIHFAAFKNHIGIYPTPSGTEAFKRELSIYQGAKGSVRLPIDEPMPLKLISRIVKFRVAENLKNEKSRSTKKK